MKREFERIVPAFSALSRFTPGESKLIVAEPSGPVCAPGTPAMLAPTTGPCPSLTDNVTG
jgi:hypothetical protein